MTTLGIMSDRIADELGQRSDLTTQIAAAIKTAIKHYERRRFYFNEIESSFLALLNQEAYGVTDNANIPNLVSIDWMMLNDGGTRYALEARDLTYFKGVSSDPAYRSSPSLYVYHEQKIKLAAIPNKTYTTSFAAIYRLASLSLTTDSNAWTTDAEELIRHQAKWDICWNLDHDRETAMLHKELAREVFETLIAETNRRISTGRLRPTQF